MSESENKNLPIVRDNEGLLQFISSNKQNFNLLVPEVIVFARMDLKLGFEQISVDTTFGRNKNGEVEKSNRDIYSVDGGKYALHKSKLNEISQSAGLKFTHSQPLEKKYDPNDGRIVYIEHLVKWEIKKLDGSKKEGTSTGYYNYEEDKKRYSYQSQIDKRRTFASALAESNAKVRAINEAIAKLPQSFSLEELKKPFIVPCVVEDPTDLLKAHPDIEKEYIRKQLGLTDANIRSADKQPIMIEAPKQQQLPEPKPVEAKLTIEDAKVIETEKTKATINIPPGVTIPEYAHNTALTYKDAPQKERSETIQRLIEKTGYKRVNQTPIEKYPINRQIELIEKLMILERGMPK